MLLDKNLPRLWDPKSTLTPVGFLHAAQVVKGVGAILQEGIASQRFVICTPEKLEAPIPKLCTSFGRKNSC